MVLVPTPPACIRVRRLIPAFVNPLAGNADAARDALRAVGGFDIREVPPDTLAEQRARSGRRGGDAHSRRRRRRLDRQRGGRARRNRRRAGDSAVAERSIISRRICRCRSSSKTAARVALEGRRSRRGRRASVNDRIFLNTSSVGAYVTFVRARERLERRLGYHIASLVAGDATARSACRRFASRSRSRGVRASISRRSCSSASASASSSFRRSALASRAERPGLHVMVVRRASGARARWRSASPRRRAECRRSSRTPALDAFLVDSCTIEPRTRIAAVDGEIVRVAPPLEYRHVPGQPSGRRARRVQARRIRRADYRGAARTAVAFRL